MSTTTPPRASRGSASGVTNWTAVQALILARCLPTPACRRPILSTQATSWARLEARAITVAALKELAPVARTAGVRLAVEPIAARYPGYTFLRDIPETLDVIDAVGAAEVGIFFDTDHLYQSPNLFRDIEMAGDRLFCVHINDMPAAPGPGIDRRILGDGVIPLREILHAIAATGYDGFYDVEIMSDSVWGMDYVALIKTLKARFDALWL
jgi:sugar phosphate isomerase/epimerase